MSFVTGAVGIGRSVGARARSWAILGMEGEVLWLDDVGTPAQRAREDRIGDGSLPAFTTIRSTSRGLVATGMGRAVHVFDGDAWKPLGRGLLPDAPDDLVGFEALAESDGELSACGWRGEIWTLVGDG